jgi:hypothetical protein
MNTLYLVCSHSCMNQMEIPYLLNNSADLHGDSQAGEHYAGYELNGEPIDHEPGPLGKVRVHDDYWNLSAADREWYNFDVRNELNISDEQLDGLLNIITDKSIALLLHAHNLDDIWRWSRAKPVIVINATITDWQDNIETWAAREYNYLMEDDRNANYSGVDHHWPGCDAVADAFVARMHLDADQRKRQADRTICQPQWMRAPEIYTLWDSIGITAPSAEWIQAYLDDYAAHQEHDHDLLSQLRLAYDSHPNRYS